MKNLLLGMMPVLPYLYIKHIDYKYTHNKRYQRLISLRNSTNHQGYSYEPFDKKKAIFIHIPKCAGISINKALFKGLGGGHTRLEDYIHIFEPATFLKYKKLTIVRNPWDRLVSAYFFLKKGGFNDNDKAWSNKELEPYSSFADFVHRWLNRENIWKWPHFHPQYHYILDSKKKVQPDFIGFFENITHDFNHMAKIINVDVSLAHKNGSSHENYMNYYSEELVDKVRAVYKEDIELFGYNFDNSSLGNQIKKRNNGELILTEK